MPPILPRLGARLRRGAEHVAAALMAVIFVAFVIQIVLRYGFDLPLGWTSELSIIAWLWLVLWGASFVTTDEEEIRLDLLVAAAGPRVRRWMEALGTLAVLGLLGASLPASWAYVRFMRVERSAYMDLPFDGLYAIYIVFVLALMTRGVWRLARMLRGDGGPGAPAPGDAPTRPE